MFDDLAVAAKVRSDEPHRSIRLAGQRQQWAVLVAWSMWALQREPNWS